MKSKVFLFSILLYHCGTWNSPGGRASWEGKITVFWAGRLTIPNKASFIYLCEAVRGAVLLGFLVSSAGMHPIPWDLTLPSPCCTCCPVGMCTVLSSSHRCVWSPAAWVLCDEKCVEISRNLVSSGTMEVLRPFSRVHCVLLSVEGHTRVMREIVFLQG